MVGVLERAVLTKTSATWEAPGSDGIACRKEHIRSIAFGRKEIYIRKIAPKKFDVSHAEVKYPELIFTRKDGSKALQTFQGILNVEDFSFQPVRNTKEFGLVNHGKRIADGLRYLEAETPSFYGTYFVVNEGINFTNDGITKPTSLFYEIDDLSLDEQYKKLQKIEAMVGTKASIAIETDKSIHCYWQLATSTELKDWKRYEERLLDFLNADRTIKNPARLMRLPGFNHIKFDIETGEFTEKMVRVVQRNDTTVSLKDFDFLPECDREKRDRIRTEHIERERQKLIDTTKLTGGAFNLTSYDEEKASIDAIREAVNYLPVRIPGMGTYGLCRDALWGLCATVGIDDAARLYEMHSPSGGDWDVSKIAREFRPGDITSGTFWWYAKQGGYRAPIRQRTKEQVRRQVQLKNESAKKLTRIQVADNESGVYSKALSYGKKYILDQRLTGAGKTHSVEEITDPMLYCCPTPYNPATPYLFTVPKMPARHSGRYEHPDKLNAIGRPLTEATDNGGVFKPGNCINAEEANLASSAGVEMRICAECPMKMNCLSGEAVIPGGEPGYLWQMAKAKNEPQLRLHPQSLPRIKEHDDIDFYTGKTLVFDDVSVTAPTTKKVGHRHVLRLNKVIQDSAVNGKLKAFFRRLADLSIVAKMPENKWGLPAIECKPDHPLHELGDRLELEMLQKIEYGQIEVNYPAMGDTLVAENGIKTADIKAFEAARNEERRLAVVNAYKNEGIGAIVNPLIYHPKAIISFNADGDLLMSWHDDVISNAIAASKTVWISDATGSIEDITKLYGISESDLLVIESAPRDNANLELIEASGFGSLTKYTDQSQVTDVIGVVASRASELGAGKVGLIINYESAGDDALLALSTLGVITGKPHSDSRGSNAFSGCQEIYAGTSFVQNKGSLADEFSLIYGELVHPGDTKNPDWLEFCWRKQAAEVIQYCGRGRHTRRAGETVKIVLLGQLPEVVLGMVADALPGADCRHEFRVDFDGISFREHELKKLAIFDAVQQCREGGDGQLTWNKLEKMTDISASTIRSIFTDGGKIEPSVKRQQLFGQIDSGLCYLPSQKLQMVAPESFDKRNKHQIDKARTDAEIEQIVDARVAYIQQIEENKELAIEILPIVDPDYWQEIEGDYDIMHPEDINWMDDPPN